MEQLGSSPDPYSGGRGFESRPCYVAWSYIALGDNHFFGMQLVDGQPVDVSTWSPRAIREAVDKGYIVAVPTAGIDGGGP